MPQAKNTIDRVLAERVSVQSGGCWAWLGAHDRDGYAGLVTVAGVAKRAHRFLFEHERGPVPVGKVLHHACRNRGCVNPAHIEPLTIRETVHRGSGLQPFNAGKTACAQGHPLSGDNLYNDPRGWRGCRACRRAATARCKTGVC